MEHRWLWPILWTDLFFGRLRTRLAHRFNMAGNDISGSLFAPLFYEKVMTKKGQSVKRGNSFKGISDVDDYFARDYIDADGAIRIAFNLRGLFRGGSCYYCLLCLSLRKQKDDGYMRRKARCFSTCIRDDLASLPLWIVLAIYGLFTVGPPSIGQSVQSGIVAITSGVIATILFFQATDLVRGNMQKLGT